ncbi:MAG: hypothetical protein HQ568_07095 [Calditrichaeota bacterium]|nr:hypothetical protein [Calditrichota bacterium]
MSVNWKNVAVLSICLIIGTNAHGQINDGFELELRGQVSAWSSETNASDLWRNNSGVRYIPRFSVEHSLSDDLSIGGDIALNGYWSVESENEPLAEVELYRLKLQLTSNQSDLRLGLQKINFGPGQLLRPLMWFDYIDPRDPLKMTDGVWGARFRRFFSNNANLWAWVLYGNEEIRGNDEHATTEHEPEFGVAFQYPVPRGEVGVSTHHRQAVASYTKPSFTENRLALDGRWDVLIGLWFEAAIIERRTKTIPEKWLKFAMIGTDFTFGIGNGLYMLCEHESISRSKEWGGFNENVQISAYMLSYPINLLDNLNLYGFYSWEQENLYNYIGWQRTYDNLIVNLNLFIFPKSKSTGNDNELGAINSGQGIQLMLIYNH